MASDFLSAILHRTNVFKCVFAIRVFPVAFLTPTSTCGSFYPELISHCENPITRCFAGSGPLACSDTLSTLARERYVRWIFSSVQQFRVRTSLQIFIFPASTFVTCIRCSGRPLRQCSIDILTLLEVLSRETAVHISDVLPKTAPAPARSRPLTAIAQNEAEFSDVCVLLDCLSLESRLVPGWTMPQTCHRH